MLKLAKDDTSDVVTDFPGFLALREDDQAKVVMGWTFGRVVLKTAERRLLWDHINKLKAKGIQ
ncbi:hypothetical protein HGRIS_002983 [Hohenbuehelia grisea]|uniref:Uncharacterized protein n=1 Tax=Hohenbuehelia grisea TaxID=104357 RepID=A0ABR3JP25_9AGAR